MYAMTCYQTALLTHCLITDFTGILALTTRYVCIYALSDYSCHCMPYNIHHKYTGANHCVRAYALSGYSCHYTPYYKHHKHKGAHQCVCVYALPDLQCD